MKFDFQKNASSLLIIILTVLFFYSLSGRKLTSHAQMSELAAVPTSYSLGKACRVIAPLLNVRSSPNGQVVGTLKFNDSVINNGSEGSWIETNSGYVHSRYVSC